MEIWTLFKAALVEALKWLIANPGVFAAFVALFGVLLSALISYFGVRSTIRATDRRDFKKLDADIAQKDKEREINLRKEVYLAAASGMIKAQKYLAGMVKGDLSNLNAIDQLDDFFAAVAKIEIVGTYETIEKIDAVMRQFNESHNSLLLGALHMDAINNEMRITRDDIEFKENSFNRLLSSLQNDNSKSPEDLIKLNIEINALGENLTVLENQLPEYRKNFCRKCMKESLKVSSLIYPAVVAIREELHLHIDSEKYSTLKKGTLAKIDSDIDAFLTNLDQGLH
jgi:hypothetical protein